MSMLKVNLFMSKIDKDCIGQLQTVKWDDVAV